MTPEILIPIGIAVAALVYWLHTAKGKAELDALEARLKLHTTQTAASAPPAPPAVIVNVPATPAPPAAPVASPPPLTAQQSQNLLLYGNINGPPPVTTPPVVTPPPAAAPFDPAKWFQAIGVSYVGGATSFSGTIIPSPVGGALNVIMGNEHGNISGSITVPEGTYPAGFRFTTAGGPATFTVIGDGNASFGLSGA